jgi:hypothetical protein
MAKSGVTLFIDIEYLSMSQSAKCGHCMALRNHIVGHVKIIERENLDRRHHSVGIGYV